MNNDNATLENLARSSLRLSKGLSVAIGLTLLLLGGCYWALQHLIAHEQEDVSFHFARLMENIQEQETFLRGLLKQSSMGELVTRSSAPMHNQSALTREGPDVYAAQEYSFSTPFSLAFDRNKIPVSETPKIFSLGVHLASYYSTFWSESHYQSPQLFLFNMPGNYDIAVPAVGHLRGAISVESGMYKHTVDNVSRQLLARNPEAPSTSKVYWEPYTSSNKGAETNELLASINILIKPKNLKIKGASQHVVIASLLNMSQVNDLQRTMDWTIYDHFTLITPSGSILTGALKPDQPLVQGLNFTADGLVFKITSEQTLPWTAIYAIHYSSFLGYALWPLLSLLASFLAIIAAIWLITRWYQSRIIKPAQLAHRNLIESEMFNRAVIESAPAGLCVIRLSDYQVLLENKRAQQWQGTAKLVAMLDQHRELAGIGHANLDIDGRHLQTVFILTRYHGEDVLLCAFNDVTGHIEDAASLEQAKQTADAANAAKTIFLATMSHEIRTPLYGVLGTLELLGLTTLSGPQKDYLSTIQRSSATLFQLISNVLDVSKIESGQMPIDRIKFCPLDVLEDALRTYSAAATAKGLQLHGCIDATLPDWVEGDPIRLKQILHNLLSNAIKFTDIGHVLLRCKVLSTRDKIVNLELEVVDSGIGISKAQQSKLFEPFYQVPNQYSEGGAGLGLAICGWICELMEGQLHVVSEPGLGSSFSLQLPLGIESGEQTGADLPMQAYPVYVRAACMEQAQTISEWLNRFGAYAIVAPEVLPDEHLQAVLVDAALDSNDIFGRLPKVVCTSGGPSPPLYNDDAGWQVDVNDISAIALAVCYAQQGKTTACSSADVQPQQPLDLRILVAEDNPTNQAVIKKQLTTLGCDVTVASDGLEALQLWQPRRFDMVLTDVNMPVMNGYELARLLREKDPAIPILGLTANAMREEGIRCIAGGMNAWIVKPLDLQTLRSYLVRLCGPLPLHGAAESEQQPFLKKTEEIIDLPPDMRNLLKSSMREDVRAMQEALIGMDYQRAAQHLHSMAGALGAVEALILCEACASLEDQLLETGLTPQVTQSAYKLAERLVDFTEHIPDPSD